MKAGNAIWVVAVAAAVAVGVGCGDGDGGELQQRTVTLPTPEVTLAPTRPATGEGPEPSGKIAFVGSHEGNREIYVMNADGSDLRNLTNDPAQDFHEDISADGGKIVFVSDRTGGNHLFVMDADGSNVKQITLDRAGGLNPRWSNDGTKIVYTRGVDLAVIGANGGEPTVIMEAQRQDEAVPCRGGAFPGNWSPDDSRIIYSASSGTGRAAEVCTIAADGSDIEVVVGDPPGLHIEPVWSADGRYIVYRSVRSGIHDVWVLDQETGESVNVTNSAEIVIEPAWSPDGEWIALAVLVQGEPHFDIYLMRKDGSDLRRLTEHAAREAYPSWGP